MNMKPFEIAICIGLIIIVSILGWNIRRQWNYSWGYNAMVESTVEEKVCEMVKPEYLKDPSDC